MARVLPPCSPTRRFVWAKCGLVLSANLWWTTDSHARPRKVADSEVTTSPVATPLPETAPPLSLEALLEREGLNPTPKPSKWFEVGSIFVVSPEGRHDVVMTGCLDDVARSALITGAIADRLSEGVVVGVWRSPTSDAPPVEHDVRFRSPKVSIVPKDSVRLNARCLAELSSLSSRSGWSVGRSSAYLVVGTFSADLLEPDPLTKSTVFYPDMVLGYRTIPLLELLESPPRGASEP